MDDGSARKVLLALFVIFAFSTTFGHVEAKIPYFAIVSFMVLSCAVFFEVSSYAVSRLPSIRQHAAAAEAILWGVGAGFLLYLTANNIIHLGLGFSGGCDSGPISLSLKSLLKNCGTEWIIPFSAPFLAGSYAYLLRGRSLLIALAVGFTAGVLTYALLPAVYLLSIIILFSIGHVRM